MTLARWATLARKAMHRPPRYVLSRLAREARLQARRPWSRIRPRMLSDDRLLRETGYRTIDELWTALAERPFFLRPSDRTVWANEFLEDYPEEAKTIVSQAEAVLRHEFDLLGSGPCPLGGKLPWHQDFKSRRTWPLRSSHDIDTYDLSQPSDIKVPWELSRCQHFTRLGQAYWLTGDERYAREFADEVEDWIASNPWLHGVNWVCAMDVALRAMSWIWGFGFFAGAEACRSPRFRSSMLRALYLHGEFVSGNIEHSDVNGNHYLTDGVGLVFLGTFFARTTHGAAWLRTGRTLVFDEILKQTTPDGVDFEQSFRPPAGARGVPDRRTCCCAFMERPSRTSAGSAWSECSSTWPPIRSPMGWRRFTATPTTAGCSSWGRRGSTIIGICSAPAPRCSADPISSAPPDDSGTKHSGCAALPAPGSSKPFLPTAAAASSVPFRDGGIYVMRDRNTHVFIDCAPIGLAGMGGHGHNDILGFELFLDGSNVVTDCGAYVYTASAEWRDRFRSTAFHNTVQVDDEELNRFLDGDMWRLQYDAVPTPVSWSETPGEVRLLGGHEGYQRLASPVSHEREFVLQKGRDRLLIVDRLTGGGHRRLVSRFHLDPSVTPALQGEKVRLQAGGRDMWFMLLSAPEKTTLTIEPAWVSPRYGHKVPTQCITVSCTTALPSRLAYAFAVDASATESPA